MTIFNEADLGSNTVTRNPEKLFAWNKPGALLDQIFENVRHGDTFLLYGERKSGKTSLLRCLVARIEARLPACLPVLLDFQDIFGGNISSTGSYKHILEQIFIVLEDECGKPDSWSRADLDRIIERRAISPVPGENDIDLVISARFRDVEKLMREYGKTLVLFFDDCERLPQYFPDNRDSFFYPVRKLRQNWDPDRGGISFVLAGAEKLEFFEHRTGSPQFNNVGDEIAVEPLCKNDFVEMWEIMLEACPVSQNISGEEAYALCGGRAALAKLLLDCLRKGEDPRKSKPINKILQNIYDRHPDGQKYLRDIALGELPDDDAPQKRLESFHLIEENSPDMGGFHICGSLWRDFLKDKTISNPPVMEIQNAGQLAEILARDVNLEKLLKLRHLRGEYADWLEFKEYAIPDNSKYPPNKTEGDMLWHIAKEILAMRNTRGGLILLGVADDGALVGIDYDPHNDGAEFDYIRRFVKKMNNAANPPVFKGRDEHLNLEKCEWKLDNVKWINFKMVKIDGKYVLAIIVHPQPEFFDKDHFLKKIKLKNQGVWNRLLLVRNNFASIDIIDVDRKDIDQAIKKHQDFCAQSEDLERFWQDFNSLD